MRFEFGMRVFMEWYYLSYHGPWLGSPSGGAAANLRVSVLVIPSDHGRPLIAAVTALVVMVAPRIRFGTRKSIAPSVKSRFRVSLLKLKIVLALSRADV
jgi:hypothetical protein